jgi:hypothetical protein
MYKYVQFNESKKKITYDDDKLKTTKLVKDMIYK